MGKCTGECYQQEWKVKKGSISVNSRDFHVLPKEGETQRQADRRCQDERRPTKLEMEAAMATAITQYVTPTNKVCVDADNPGKCQCAWPDWEPWLPADKVDGQDVEKKWLQMTIKVPFQRNAKCGFWSFGWFKVKVRQRTGKCVDTQPERKISFIPEWEIDLNDSELASLSKKSKKILKEKFA